MELGFGHDALAIAHRSQNSGLVEEGLWAIFEEFWANFWASLGGGYSLVGHLALRLPLRNFGPIFGLMVFKGGSLGGRWEDLVGHLTFWIAFEGFWANGGAYCT